MAFVANIPVQIEAHWNPRYAHLAGFPFGSCTLPCMRPTANACRVPLHTLASVLHATLSGREPDEPESDLSTPG